MLIPWPIIKFTFSLFSWIKFFISLSACVSVLMSVYKKLFFEKRSSNHGTLQYKQQKSIFLPTEATFKCIRQNALIEKNEKLKQPQTNCLIGRYIFLSCTCALLKTNTTKYQSLYCHACRTFLILPWFKWGWNVHETCK